MDPVLGTCADVMIVMSGDRKAVANERITPLLSEYMMSTACRDEQFSVSGKKEKIKIYKETSEPAGQTGARIPCAGE
jgi:hypothetical protein